MSMPGASPAPVRPRLTAGTQAVRIGFWFIAAVAVFTACAWAVSNVTRIPADSRAVVLRFDALERIQDGGLVIAWPRPFERVVMVPGPARVLEARITGLERDPRARQADKEARSSVPDASPSGIAGWSFTPGARVDAGPVGSDALAGSGYLLTGDDGLAQLGETVFYRVTDPYAYVLAQARLPAALDRLATAATAAVAASRDLDALTVARPELAASTEAAAGRERLRGDLASALQQRLAALAANGAPLGIEVARVDVQASFPAAAVDAFESVLSAMQSAERAIAQARTDAETIRQGARQKADQVLQGAQASATERVATARAETTTILQLEAPLGQAADPGLFARVYRDKVQGVLAKAGRVTTIDSRDTSSLILPGKVQ
jgi:regulator of protease activity HflC (stomatin/prohibitin superfamily)